MLNQVLVRFTVPGGNPEAGDRLTRAVILEVQAEGTIWRSGTVWHDVAAMRISGLKRGHRAGASRSALRAILRAADGARLAPEG